MFFVQYLNEDFYSGRGWEVMIIRDDVVFKLFGVNDISLSFVEVEKLNNIIFIFFQVEVELFEISLGWIGFYELLGIWGQCQQRFL